MPTKGIWKPATCHPERRDHGRGLCSTCYTQQVGSLKPKEPKWKPSKPEIKFDKQDLLNTLEVIGLTKSEAKRAFDAVFIAITTALHSGEEVEVRGFGRFHFRRVRHGFKGHETKWAVAFRPTYAFKKLLADNQEVGEWFERRYVRGRKPYGD